jgi:Tfp pilus assembly protein PilX
MATGGGDRWRGVAVTVLALAVGTIMVLSALDAYRQHGRISSAEADLLLALSGAAVGALAVYLGGHNGNGRGPGG